MNLLDARYRLDALLGTGGFGAVYRAHDLQLGHDVAIKLLHPNVDANAAKRLAREAKVLARLDHPNCVRLLEFGNHNGAPYLVLELIAGHPLADELGEAWTPSRVVDMALQLLAGLAHAHALELVHRDLKPGNVLLTDDPGETSVKIIDFGIVSVAAGDQLGSFTEQLTATGKIIGTPRYMSPEQLLGAKVDARSDLYACGLILYELLAGRPAFQSSDVRRLAWMHAVAPPPPLPDDVPDALARLVEQLLAKPRERRPESAMQVRERLLALRDEPAGDAAAPTLTATVREDASDSQPDASAQEADARIGHFRLLRELGRGAMGVVWLAWDESLERLVALKRLRASLAEQQASERLLREARGLARVTHPNVVQVFEVGSQRGAIHVAMQYVPGRTLRAWLGEQPRTWRDKLVRLVEAGRGLAAVHAAGLVHRDVKPDNLLIGDDGHARVLDFGLVRASSPAIEMIDRLALERPDVIEPDPLAAKLTRTGAIIGTPAYMALEQLAGDEVDARTDQFAFCVVVYEALHGQRPIAGDNLEVLAANLTAGRLRGRPPGSAVPDGVDEVLARGLRVMPSERWPNMDALLDALEHAGRLRARWSWRAGIAGGIGVALIVSLGLVFGRGDEDPSEPLEAANPSASQRDESHGAREAELAQALDRQRALLARARPEDPASWNDVLELGLGHRGGETMPLELRASLHAVAGAVHESHALREVGEVAALAWSPTSGMLALAKREGGLVLWDAETRTSARALEHDEPFESLVFSQDGELLLARDRSRRAILWHVATGTKLGTIASTVHVGFLADTQQLVIAGDEGVALWGLVRGKELERARVLREKAGVLALASSSERMLVVDAQGRASSWTLGGEPLANVVLAGFDVTAPASSHVLVSPTASRIARTSAAGLELWDANTGTQLASLAGKLDALAFSADDSLVLAFHARVPALLEGESGETRALAMAAREQTWAIAFDPSGSRLLALADEGLVEVVELDSGRVIDRIVGAADGARTMQLDPTGSRLASLGDDGLVRVSARHAIAIADAQPPRRMYAGEAPIIDLALAPSGARLATLGADGRVRCLDAATGAVVHELPHDGSAWVRIAMASDERLVGADAEGRIVVWSLPSGEQLASFAATGPITALAVSSDASRIATAQSAILEIWSSEGVRERSIVVDTELRALAFSPDGSRLACAGVGPRVEVWSVREGSREFELHTREQEIRALAFAPDRGFIMVGGRETRAWQLDAGFDLGALTGPASPVLALGLSPDGRQLAIAHDDGSTTRRWVDEAVLVERLCRALVAGDGASATSLRCPENSSDNR